MAKTTKGTTAGELHLVETEPHAPLAEIRERLATQARALRAFLTLAGEIDSDEAGLIPSDVSALLTPIWLEMSQIDDELRATEEQSRA